MSPNENDKGGADGWLALSLLPARLENLRFCIPSFSEPRPKEENLLFSSSGHLLSLWNTGLIYGQPMRKVLI